MGFNSIHELELKKRTFSLQRIFSSVTGPEIENLAERTPLMNYDAGSVIFSAGDEAGSLYLIVSGEVSAFHTDDDGTTTEIARIAAGESLGTMDLVTGNRRDVTVRAANAVSVMEFPPDGMHFRQYLAGNPGTGARILFGLISDIAERTRQANALLKENSPHLQELRRQIYEDKLTGLGNRTFLEEKLPELTTDPQKQAALLMFKPDNFKEVNDRSGHEAGDSLLVQLARLLPSVTGRGSILARFNGNEFALALPATGRDGALEMAERIRKFYNELDVSRFLDEEGFHLTVSTGIALYPEHSQTAAGLIGLAHPLPLAGRAMGGNAVLFPGTGTGATP
jgi:diguanylate cyclase (GGDEF) domain